MYLIVVAQVRVRCLVGVDLLMNFFAFKQVRMFLEELNIYEFLRNESTS